MTPSEVEARVERDRICALFAQVGASTLAVAAATAGLVVVAMWDSVARSVLLGWLALYVANLLLRLLMARAFEREKPAGERLRLWAGRYTLAMAASGAIFGSLAWLMFPQASPLGQMFLMIIVTGVSAASITTNAWHPPAMRSYLLLMLLPMLLRLAYEGGLEYGLMAVAFGFYLAVLLAFGRDQAALIVRSFTVANENVGLLEELRRKTDDAEAAQRKAEQASLAKSQFFAAASHDLRQPMQALGLFAASLRETKREPQDARRVDQILSSVDALESLFDELLDINKLDAGYVKPTPSHFRAQTLFERLQNTYAPVARKSGLALRFEHADAVLHTDSVLLERVLGNLISNALRYTSAGSAEVRCRPRGNGVAIEVADTGPGIPREEHERVFDEFYQLGNPERDRRKGLGLGLATVKRIAQLLGCSITLDSAPGQGSVFAIEVPLGDASCVTPTPVPQTAAELDALQDKVIAVVDDERDVRDGLAELLTTWRCRPVVAASARELLEQLETAGLRPDALIADHRLRERETGPGAVAALRERFGAWLPALIMSGDTTPEIFQIAREQQLPLLSKPVRAARLRAALQHLLSAAQLTASRQPLPSPDIRREYRSAAGDGRRAAPPPPPRGSPPAQR
jgi:signal transduction histidine kinase/FixJ family two-component response regulator